MVVFGQKWLYSDKSGCIRAKVALFRQMWLYLGKSGCNRVKLLYSDNKVVFGKNGFLWARWLYSGKIVCTRAKVVLFRQSGCIRQK